MRRPPGRGGAAGIGAGTSMWRERSQDSLVSIHFWRGVLGKGCPDSTHHGRIASPNALVRRKRSSGQARRRFATPVPEPGARAVDNPPGRRGRGTRPPRDGTPAPVERGRGDGYGDQAWTSTYPPEAEEFRGEIAGWLEENLPEGWGEPGLLPDARGDARPSTRSGRPSCSTGGWICASWPTEYGGKGLSLLQQVVLNEEFARVGAPLRADFFGDTLVGPTILQWGTEEQKQQFIPGILKGEIAWCQGFSEPDAGSDLAGLKTRAELDGDEWVINGQKVWTTQAHYADYIFLLARTDPDAPKHAGISYLLVPMKQPGVEVRPIEQIDGSAEFNEVFFTNVRCPEGQRHRRREQRMEGRHDDARVRARHVGDDRAPPVPEGVRPDPGRGARARGATATR